MRGSVVLAARGLEVGYPGFALRVPELELRAGEVLAVLGPNGAGKSTLLRALAGLLAPAAGSVERAKDREVALVFQRPLAFGGSVAYNAELPLWARGVPRSERRRRAGEALRALGIAHLAGRSATTLSGGELRRLALARAFATRPGVLLLDEPFDDLDAPGRETLSADLARAIAETGVAVTLVSHELRQALLLAERIAVLVGGRLVQTGARDAVLRRPATAEVAGLVGMANLLRGRVASAAGGLVEVELDGGARLQAASSSAETAFGVGAPVFAGVRPECVRLAALHGDVGAAPPSSRARIVRLADDGVVTTAWLDWHDTELRTHLVAGRGLGHTLKCGDVVSISIQPEGVHVLPRR